MFVLPRLTPKISFSPDPNADFYQFGEPNYLLPIPTEDWIPFVQQKFADRGLEISADSVRTICESVKNQQGNIKNYSM